MESMPKQVSPDTSFAAWKAQADVDELNKHRKETWSEWTARHKYKLAAGAATLGVAGHSVYCRQQTETNCADAYGCRWRSDKKTCMPSWENAVRGVLDPSSTNSDNTDLKTPIDIAPVKGQPKAVDKPPTERPPVKKQPVTVKRNTRRERTTATHSNLVAGGWYKVNEDAEPEGEEVEVFEEIDEDTSEEEDDEDYRIETKEEAERAAKKADKIAWLIKRLVTRKKRTRTRNKGTRKQN